MLTLIAVRAVDNRSVYEEELFEGTLEQAVAHWTLRMTALNMRFGQVLRRDGFVCLNLTCSLAQAQYTQ